MSPLDRGRALIFTVSGRFGHFKRIFATTSALSYPLPPKTSVYGLLGAIIGGERENNAYLRDFQEGHCKIAIQLVEPIRTLRMTMNLRPDFGSLYLQSSKGNRKPTTMEFLYCPAYRIFVAHADEAVYKRLRDQLAAGRSVFTPSLGLANLIARVHYEGEGQLGLPDVNGYLPIDSVIPKSSLVALNPAPPGELRLQEASQYAVEMTPERDVTVRDDILLDREGNSISASVSMLHSVDWDDQKKAHVVFF